MEKFDYKKEYKDLYMPSNKKPVLVNVPAMNFILVDGRGDPNNNPEFQKAVEALYSISFTIKMSPKKGTVPDGYFDYVVPPLEGLWWLEGDKEFSFNERDNWRYSLMIRQPEFVTRGMVERTISELKTKKGNEKLDNVRFEEFNEGLCVQMMHIGPYSTEPETIEKMDNFIIEKGYVKTIGAGGKHHEIYLSDPRRTKPEKQKTVLRVPVRFSQKSV